MQTSVKEHLCANHSGVRSKERKPHLSEKEHQAKSSTRFGCLYETPLHTGCLSWCCLNVAAWKASSSESWRHCARDPAHQASNPSCQEWEIYGAQLHWGTAGCNTNLIQIIKILGFAQREFWCVQSQHSTPAAILFWEYEHPWSFPISHVQMCALFIISSLFLMGPCRFKHEICTNKCFLHVIRCGCVVYTYAVIESLPCSSLPCVSILLSWSVHVCNKHFMPSSCAQITHIQLTLTWMFLITEALSAL